MMRSLTTLVALWLLFCGFQPGRFRTEDADVFRIQIERGIPARDVKAVRAGLLSAYEEIRKELGRSLAGRTTVILYANEGRLKKDVTIGFFPEGSYKGKRIHLAVPILVADEARMRSICRRVVARAILAQWRYAPTWLCEAYSLYLGGDLSRYSKPSQVNVSTFSDLGEDFARSERLAIQREIYAKLALTGQFLVERYGQPKIRQAIAGWKYEAKVDQVFEKAFGEKVTVIEKAWVDALTDAVRR
jgi:hypothetical protein